MSERTRHVVGYVIVFALTLAWRAYLIDSFPSIYWWDAFTRIWERDTLFVRHWLPLPQLPLYALSSVTEDLSTVRLAYASLGTLACVFMGACLARLSSHRVGIAFAALASLTPAYVQYTITPYQEGIFFLLFGIWGLLFLDTGDEHAESVDDAPTEPGQDPPPEEHDAIPLARARRASWFALGLAQLCRFEAWILAFMLSAWALLRRDRDAFVKSLSGLIVPAIWFLTSPVRPRAAGGPRHEQAVSFSRMVEGGIGTTLSRTADFSVELLNACAEGSSLALAPLALVGVWAFLKTRRPPRLYTGLCALAFIALVLVRALNSETLSSRMPITVIMMYLAFGMLGLEALLSRLSRPRLSSAITAAFVIALALASQLPSSGHRVQNAASAFTLEAHAARLLEELPPDTKVVIIPRPFGNPWAESTVSSIFGHSLSLEPDDPRWLYPKTTNFEGFVIDRGDYDLVLLFDPRVRRYALYPVSHVFK
jgi:putative Ca2+/H+ antiporter (TMEM165/GDT1 family)